ncbi:unnamed protein product [Tilletia controversa]|uniref:F-box domain-containing protein n=2 Tax=Tilletia TaxID=13289 RepID=A0A177U9K7_9BASI|nr:hypothetical protein CF336_g4966 [Tilletia laevis]KAE8259073.1 hypothetical protein A4X03_0g4202 [Tilletia caries]CAD6928700.1 unnamed protein product [Tilletia controversa]KAE8199394.1 hypothetical protein CF335_g4184 [Tilletia laevis]CAD6887633.1 unnamed protein product [Tilletia caries]
MSPPPSVYRFLNVAELVEYLLAYLSRERVDLLALSAVSKAFRIYALRVWAKYLDIPTSAVGRRLKLFKANPRLLGQVRFVRIRNDVLEHEYHQISPSPRLPITNWDALGSLLALLHKNQLPNSFPPAIDITLGHTDIYPLVTAFRTCPGLKERIVAIRIIPVLPPAQDPYRFMGDPEAEDMEMESQHGDWNCHWYALYQFIFEVQRAASKRAGPGLRTFHYGHNGVMEEDMEALIHMIPPDFWRFFNDSTASTLRDFAVRLGVADRNYLILPALKFARLEKFFIAGTAFGEPDELDDFLDRHSAHLQELSLDIDDIHEPLSFKQTFPRLRWLQVWAPFPPLERRIEFNRRHPHIRGTQDSSLITQLTSSNSARDVYPNLRQLTSTYTEPFERFAKAGGRLSHVRLKTGFPPEPLNLSTLHTNSWLSRHPDAARALTCLEIELGFVDMNKIRVFFASAFGSAFLPNLAELSVVWAKHTPRGALEASAEQKIGPLVSGCIKAASLRVLRFSDRSKAFPQHEILIEHVFPPSLEHLVWLEPPRHKPQYFRFLPSPPSSSSSTPALGKRGRLQCIPAIFRVDISPEGVWEKAFDSGRATTLLDHVSS